MVQASSDGPKYDGTPKTSEFPEVKGGGSLMLAWQVRNKTALVIGGGEVAAGRILNLLNADANILLISPQEGLNDEVQYRLKTLPDRIKHIDRKFEPSDLDDPEISLVLCAIDDPLASSEVYRLCHERRIPANIADVPPECDFYFGSVHRDGPLQIMVSTNGQGPRLAAKIRKWIGNLLPGNAGEAVQNVGVLRAKLRKVAPEPAQGPQRMKWMSTVSDKYSWEEICELTDEDMMNLLGFYHKNAVPEFNELRAMRKNNNASTGNESVDKLADVFDGSFGFSVGA